ncbi:hypothetical protein GBF35_38045 [Nonomuraea phyllanthi]|uniref:hypothetical protein n=1 Tax=Nonomuraea phyllanthi TaxID=2219224 RepID=UPI001293707C|nr:hypothetical protein [Nonomuraea phyllanthi]QFY11615.1 hypothetical protein GBF35_38045 [Nonomuraea phyllanthi]
MLRLFGLTGRNIFLATGVAGLGLGGSLALSGEEREGAIFLQMAMVAMLGAIACAISEHRDKRD